MSIHTNLFTHQRPYARIMVILAVLIALVASAFPSTGYAEGEWPLVNGTVTVINNEPGDQVDAHVSGGLVTYANIGGGASDVRYYDLLTGTDTGIPQVVSLDFLPAIEGTKIVYTHVTNTSYEINFYDTNTGGSPVTLDPHPYSLREKPAIGGQTVVWVDYGFSDDPFLSEIVVYDLASGTTTRLTNDSYFDTDPDISPDGSLIVWTKCQVYATDCHTWQAAYNGSSWDVAPLAGSGDQLHPATDGQYIVYHGYYNDNTQDRNIFWQLRGDSEEHELALPGTQRNPAIDNGVVVFENFFTDVTIPNWNLMLYDLNHDRGFQVTETDESEVLPDIAVAPDGMVHVAWQQSDATTSADIYASTFRLPEIDNQAPVIGQITAPLEPVTVNATISASASFSDPDFADTHTAVWDWGDGNTLSGLVSEASGNGTVSGSHAYANPGVYIVTLTVADNQDAADTEIFQYVVVYNPTGGFVTGSGWINSPAGAYVPNPSLTGKAHFGFVSRYQKGATLPGGTTEFQFKAGDLSFRSTAYDWLVIAGAKAQFKGVGTINGSGNYGFLLTVTDGQVSGGGGMDKFRIKIWERSSGAVVYDNQIGADDTSDPVTAIGGGSIVIHK